MTDHRYPRREYRGGKEGADTLTTPPDPDRTTAFLNVRVADIATVYKEWSAKGAEFLTEPKATALHCGAGASKHSARAVRTPMAQSPLAKLLRR